MPLPAKGLFDFWNAAKVEKKYLLEDLPEAASKQAKAWFPGQKGWDSQQDAARHALWNAAMTAEYGRVPAGIMATAWEIPGILSGDPGSNMDLYNNATGRRIASEMANWDDILNAIRAEAELAERKDVGMFDTGPGLVIPESYKYQ